MTRLTPHFTRAEMACRHCGELPLSDTFSHFMTKLEALRVACEFPFVITSGYRCPAHPIEQRKVKSHAGAILSPHTHGAADIQCNRARAGRLVTIALIQGWLGIGLRQWGPDKGRFVHVDLIKRTEDGCPIIWTYPPAVGPREGNLDTSPEYKPFNRTADLA